MDQGMGPDGNSSEPNGLSLVRIGSASTHDDIPAGAACSVWMLHCHGQDVRCGVLMLAFKSNHIEAVFLDLWSSFKYRRQSFVTPAGSHHVKRYQSPFQGCSRKRAWAWTLTAL